MTDTTLQNPPGPRDADWQAVIASYRDASDTLRDEVARAAHNGEDIDQLAADVHAWAARALIETPATRLVHIGQKIRAADNLLNLDQLYPGLSRKLLRDVFGLMGLDSGDQNALPSPVR